MARELKVFCTAAGFYQAVVAAPNRKAALAAWGVREDLFAKGLAQPVDDPDLIAAARAQPGTIVRVPVGEAALRVSAASAAPGTRNGGDARLEPPKPPLPDRSALDRAERALSAARSSLERERARLKAERANLEQRASELEDTAARRIQSLSFALERERASYTALGGVGEPSGEGEPSKPLAP